MHVSLEQQSQGAHSDNYFYNGVGWGGGQALPEKPVQNLEMGVSRLASYSVGRVIVGSDVKCHN